MKKILLVLAALAAFVSCKNSGPDLDSEYAVDMIQEGEVIPRFSIPDRTGLVRTESDFSGKYVVYDFWATWCPDCRADVPKMKKLYKKYGDKVTFVGISFDTEPDKLDAYVAENGIGWLQLCNFIPKKESKVGDDFYVKWIPSMYLVDPDGKVVLGTVMVDKLARALKTL